MQKNQQKTAVKKDVPGILAGFWNRESKPPSYISIGKYELPVKWLLVLLIVTGAIARLWRLNTVPGGLNQDEAFSAYEAWSMLHYGTDSFGYAHPVYLTTWGSGMNALQSYLMMPFLAVFGLHNWVVRMPQVLVSLFSIWALYSVVKELFEEKTALLAALFFAVCPWHIMMSRWALESNLAPGFLLFGLCFFLKGVDRPKFYMLSALFYGLSLYGYATIWPVAAVMLLLQAVYLFWTKKLKFERYLFIAVGILALLALPLLLFLLVNNGTIEEIKTSFISIPKMPYMRASEISFENISEKFQNTWNILLNQNDGLYWNSTAEWGLYYKGTLAFALIGFCYCMKRTIISIRKREFDGCTLFVVWFFVSVGLGCLISVNVNRINSIHIPIIAFTGIGIYQLCRLLSKDFKWAFPAAVLMIVLCFTGFERFYFTTYADNIGQIFQDGLHEAVDYARKIANEGGGGIIYVSPSITYSKVLFYVEQPTDEYIETVQYTNYPSAYMNISSCGRLRFGVYGTGEPGVFLITKDEVETYKGYGYRVEDFNTVAVAYR